MTIKTREKTYKNESGNVNESRSKPVHVRHAPKELNSVFQRREDTLVAMSKAHRPPGARRETFLGKRGTQVSGPTLFTINETNGSKYSRELPDPVKKLIYRIFYSDLLIKQKTYFNRESPIGLVTKILSKVDRFTGALSARSGLGASKYPCVASVSELTYVYMWYVTRAAFLPGDSLESCKHKIISMINDLSFQTEYRSRYSTRTSFKVAPIPLRTVSVTVQPPVKSSKKTSYDDWMKGFGNKKRNHAAVASQLNGSHGEYTESDDVESDVPAPKQAPKQKSAKGVAQGKKQPKAKKEEEAGAKDQSVCKFHLENKCKRGNKCKYAHPLIDVKLDEAKLEKVIEKPITTTLVVKQPEQTCGWNGKEVLNYSGDGKFLSRDGFVFPSVEEGTLCPNVTSSGYGWVVITSDTTKGQTVKCSGAVIRATNSSAYLNIHHTPFIFKPYYNKLLETVTTSHRNKHSSIEACKAIAIKFFPELPQELVVSTIAAHNFNNEITSDLVDRTLSQLDSNFTSEASMLGVEQHRDNFWREYGTIPEGVDFDWEIRDDAVILPNSTGVVYNSQTIKGVETGNLIYAGFRSKGEDSFKYYLTCMVRFVANHRNRFTIYDVCGENVKYALKRVLGCNTNNSVYRACQYFMADAYSRKENTLPGTFLSEDLIAKFHKVARIKRYVDDDELDTYVVGNKDFHHTVKVDGASMFRHYLKIIEDLGPDFNKVVESVDGDTLNSILDLHCKVRSMVTRGRTRFHLRLDPGVLQNTLDTVVGAKDYVYRGSLLAYLQFVEPIFSREYSANIPHVKRELRKRYFNGVEIHLDSDCLVKKISLKLKREIAKFGKVGRFYATYDAGAIYAPELPDIVKTAIHGKYFWQGEHVSMTIVIMSKCTGDGMDELFREMIENINRPDHLYYVIYSDDSCLLGTYKGIKIIANSDIVSCDTSNRWPVFLGVYSLICDLAPERALGLVEQCTKPMEAVNPSNKDERMNIFMHSAFEGSGTVLTTLLNHTINNDIGVSLFTVLNHYPGIDLQIAVKLASTLVGHKVTLDFFQEIEKLQFLKRSPMRCTRMTPNGEVEEWLMCLNMGTVLRSLGTLEGDMSSRQLNLSDAEFGVMTWQDKMDEFLTSVILGLVHEPSNPILDVLRARFSRDLSGREVTQEHHKILSKFTEIVSGRANSNWVVDLNSFSARYGLSDFQIEALIRQIASSRLGATYASKACSSIFSIDYGVEDSSIGVV